MKHAILAGASSAALALGGCSMFHHSPESTQGNAGSTRSHPAYTSQAANSGSSQPQSAAEKQSSWDHANSSAKGAASADEWRQAQQKLKDDGDYKGQVDGKYGPKTAEAIKHFQKTNNLPQSGQLDQQTASKLGVSTTEGSGSSAPPANGTSSSRNSNGRQSY